MAQNLVPLYIDKISGDIVASKSSNNSSNNSSNPNATAGYEHIQLSPLLTWIIPHNNNTKRLMCQVYDSTDELIFADSLKISNDDTVTIHFGVPQSGSAKIVFF